MVSGGLYVCIEQIVLNEIDIDLVGILEIIGIVGLSDVDVVEYQLGIDELIDE